MEPTREGGPLLVEAAIDHLVFTGGAATGRLIARRLGERLVSSTMELSGCDAQFVLADADVQLAAKAAWFGATLNRGQTCIGVRRALVHRSLYDPFLQALRPWAEAAAPVTLALPAQAGQLERLVADALEKGGRVLSDQKTGGAPGEVSPAVVAGAHPGMALWQEATFAPLLAVAPFDDLDEALRLDAACPYALGASVFTHSAAQAEAVAGRLRAGSVCVNDVVMPTAHPGACFGGTADSGWGTTRGAEGLLEMSVPQVVHSKKADSFRPHYAAATGQATDQVGLLRGILHFSHGLSLGQRWRGFKQMLRALWKR
jgi:acyl-CoA reductase-like NAD-dependent aldehyde dehydrogenase